jgi:hypothetical protein
MAMLQAWGRGLAAARKTVNASRFKTAQFKKAKGRVRKK